MVKRIILWIDCEDKQCESVREKVGCLLQSMRAVHKFVDVFKVISTPEDAK